MTLSAPSRTNISTQASISTAASRGEVHCIKIKNSGVTPFACSSCSSACNKTNSDVVSLPASSWGRYMVNAPYYSDISAISSSSVETKNIIERHSRGSGFQCPGNERLAREIGNILSRDYNGPTAGGNNTRRTGHIVLRSSVYFEQC